MTLNRRLKAAVRWREILHEGDLSDCNHYQTGGVGCGSCYLEPSCVTDQPLTGWPKERPWLVREPVWPSNSPAEGPGLLARVRRLWAAREGLLSDVWCLIQTKEHDWLYRRASRRDAKRDN